MEYHFLKLFYFPFHLLEVLFLNSDWANQKIHNIVFEMGRVNGITTPQRFVFRPIYPAVTLTGKKVITTASLILG